MKLGEIVNALDENLKRYKRGEKAKNLLFLCIDAFQVDKIIKDWIRCNGLNSIQDAYPLLLREENERGLLVKTDPPAYAFETQHIADHSKEPFVLYFRWLNWGRDGNGYDLLVDLISKNEMNNAGYGTFDLSKRMFAIAFGYRKHTGNDGAMLELQQDLLDLFDCFEIEN